MSYENWKNKAQGFQTVDVRHIQGSFFEGLKKRAEALEVGEGLHIIQTFEPHPLYAVMEGLGYEHHTERRSEAEFHVWFCRVEKKEGDSSAPFKPLALLNYPMIDEKLGQIAVDFWETTWQSEKRVLPYETRLLLSLTNAVGAGRMRQAARELVKAYIHGVESAALDDVFEQVEFFVDAVSDYKSDFVLFPEYFNAPLMAKFNHLGEAQSIRGLAQYTEEIRERFVNLAISYNINIITGSMPLLKEDGALYNVGYLIRRDGSYEMYEKVHVTPDEQKSWGLSGGKMVKTFDTDCARIGVLICYDVEFPELARIMADQGMQILFVPFLTDTQNGYSRVRVCAQARAIENECFVVIAGSVGNLPRVHNMDIQYAQSGVFTPCDFAFPTDGKRAEATPNTEMILVSDVDLDLLNELHTYGSVRNLRDRRHDLYELRVKKQ